MYLYNFYVCIKKKIFLKLCSLLWHLDSTFFKEFHNGLARIIRFLLKKEGPSEAIFLSPKRGNSLDKFLETIKQNALSFSVTENYNAEVWKHHQAFMHGKDSWPSYEKDHCYPLLVRITIWNFGCYSPLFFTSILGCWSSWLIFSIAGWAIW